MRVAESISLLRQLMKDPPNAFDAERAFEHVFNRASVVSSAREPSGGAAAGG